MYETQQQLDTEPQTIRITIEPPPLPQVITLCGDPSDMDLPENQRLLRLLLADEGEE